MKRTVKRRDFIKSMGLATAACTTGMSSIIATSCGTKRKSSGIVNKRDAVFELLASDKIQDYYPSGFFIHFGKDYKFGDTAINRHLEYFNFIGMDFVKIQYELSFPRLNYIQKPSDWANMPLYKKDFYDKQLYVVKELVKKGKSLAPVIATLYSPFMCAGHSIKSKLLTEHMKEDPEMVKKGLDIITESVMLFAKECIKLGVDGFLTCTQGGESFRFNDKSLFLEYIKPTDMAIMEEVNSACDCNILHICDDEGDYDDLSPFIDYPGQIVNCSLKLGDGRVTPAELYKLFDRPYMGGMQRNGVIENGTKQEIQNKVSNVLDEASKKFILGANCTLLGHADWENIRTAVETAHSYNR